MRVLELTTVHQQEDAESREKLTRKIFIGTSELYVMAVVEEDDTVQRALDRFANTMIETLLSSRCEQIHLMLRHPVTKGTLMHAERSVEEALVVTALLRVVLSPERR